MLVISRFLWLIFLHSKSRKTIDSNIHKNVCVLRFGFWGCSQQVPFNWCRPNQNESAHLFLLTFRPLAYSQGQRVTLQFYCRVTANCEQSGRKTTEPDHMYDCV